jgi:hypothetical protein
MDEYSRLQRRYPSRPRFFGLAPALRAARLDLPVCCVQGVEAPSAAVDECGKCW